MVQPQQMGGKIILIGIFPHNFFPPCQNMLWLIFSELRKMIAGPQRCSKRIPVQLSPRTTTTEKSSEEASSGVKTILILSSTPKEICSPCNVFSLARTLLAWCHFWNSPGRRLVCNSKVTRCLLLTQSQRPGEGRQEKRLALKIKATWELLMGA